MNILFGRRPFTRFSDFWLFFICLQGLVWEAAVLNLLTSSVIEGSIKENCYDTKFFLFSCSTSRFSKPSSYRKSLSINASTSVVTNPSESYQKISKMISDIKKLFSDISHLICIRYRILV